jgi:hypothetical protein
MKKLWKAASSHMNSFLKAVDAGISALNNLQWLSEAHPFCF